MKFGIPFFPMAWNLGRACIFVSIFALSSCGPKFVAHQGLKIYPPDDINQDIARIDRIVRERGFQPIPLREEGYRSNSEGGVDWKYVANYEWKPKKTLQLTISQEVHGYGLFVNIIEFDDYRFQGSECDFVKDVHRAIREEFGPKMTHDERVFCNRFAPDAG